VEAKEEMKKKNGNLGNTIAIRGYLNVTKGCRIITHEQNSKNEEKTTKKKNSLAKYKATNDTQQKIKTDKKIICRNIESKKLKKREIQWT